MSNYADSTHETIAQTFRDLAENLERGVKVTDDNMHMALCELQAALDVMLSMPRPVSEPPNFGEKA